MQDSNQGLWNRISSRLDIRWQTDWAIEDQAENFKSAACLYNLLTIVELNLSTDLRIQI